VATHNPINLYKALRYLRAEVDVKFDKFTFLEILLVLYNNKNMTQTDLVPWLDISQGSVSKHTLKMEKSWGLVKAQQGVRRLEYNLTDRGRDIVRSVMAILEPDEAPGPPTRTRIY
jgi:DNA-binding MarR family transcriptional regulator